MNAHFFDINTLITVDSLVWLVSKQDPNQPIIKISQSEFNLIKKGVFKKDEEMLKIGGKNYYLPTNLMNKLKNRCKSLNINITTLAFSMQEFMNPELIKELDKKIWKEHLIDLKNSQDEIYIICSKNNKEAYEDIIEKLEKYLFDLGLKVKNYYFFSETFYNRDENEICNNKIRLLLQHLIGLKTEGDKFTDVELDQYDQIHYYDDEDKVIDLGRTSNDILKYLTDNSEDSVKSTVKERIKQRPILLLNKVTFNKVNKFLKYEVILGLERIIKTYESFRNRF